MTTKEIIEEIKELENILRSKSKALEQESVHQCGISDGYLLSADIVKSLIEHIENSFNNYYFTFGSWEGFPYQNTYLIVKAQTIDDAVEKFRKKYPNKKYNSVLCSFFYDEEDWEKAISQHYVGQNPAEIIY